MCSINFSSLTPTWHFYRMRTWLELYIYNIYSDSSAYSDLKDSQTQRLRKLFQCPKTEIFLLAIHCYTSMLNATNLKLQSQTPLIHRLHYECIELIRTSLSRFCDTIEASDDELSTLDLDNVKRLPGKLTFIV